MTGLTRHGKQRGSAQAQQQAAHAELAASAARTSRELRCEQERASQLAGQLEATRAEAATAATSAAEAASAAAAERARLEVRHKEKI